MQLDDRIRWGIASVEEMEAAGREHVLAVKTAGDAKQVRTSLVNKAPRTVNREKRTVDLILSSEHRDRMGDVMRQKGGDLGNYKANSVVLWGHNDLGLPIGVAEKVWKGRAEDGVQATFFRPRFHTAEKGGDLAEPLWALYRDGDLRASSAGFLPTKSNRPTDDKEREKAGLGPMGVEYLEWELLEGSLVNVPANPMALAKKLERWGDSGEFSNALMREFRKTFPLSKDEAVERVRERLRSFVDMGARLAAGSEEERETVDKTNEQRGSEVDTDGNDGVITHNVETVGTVESHGIADPPAVDVTTTTDGYVPLVDVGGPGISLALAEKRAAENTRLALEAATNALDSQRETVHDLTELVRSLIEDRDSTRGGGREIDTPEPGEVSARQRSIERQEALQAAALKLRSKKG